MGSDRFRKDHLYAHDKSANHASCVMRNDRTNVPFQEYANWKSCDSFAEGASLFKHFEKPPHCNPNVKSLFVCLLLFLFNYVNWFCQTSIARPLPS